MQAEVAQTQTNSLPVEQTHADAFPTHRRHGRHPDVDLPPLVSQLEPPVLRKSALGDVEVRHDFDARGDARFHSLGESPDPLKHPIEPIPNVHPGLEWLEMDIGGGLS